MANLLRKLRSTTGRAIKSLQFGLAGELEWPSWALATRLGTALPESKADESRVLQVKYSQASFAPYRPLARTEWLFHALAAIPGGQRDRILIIGPRFANERFLAQALGFSADRISMLDTFSYSKHVDSGDMHDMRFADECFCAVVCGWTPAYSGQPKVAADEMSRVLRPGGYLVVGMDVENAAGTLVEGWPDLVALFDSLTPVARLESGGNLVAVFAKSIEDRGLA